MAYGHLNTLLDRLRRLVAGDQAEPLSDRALLERFSRDRDPAAFDILLQRHGPMVLGVCRRVLTDEHGVEDAFQATFHVLARKAGARGWHESIGPWLYRVAFHAALKARAVAGRHRSLPEEIENMTAPADQAAMWRDLRPVLDEELQRLPEKYRSPLVLCYFEGKTNEEAARELGWPSGTVKSRLAQARELLRQRLARRGLAVPAAALATLLAHQAAPAAVPTALAQATLQSLGTAVPSALSATTTAIIEGVLHNMFLTKVKLACLGVLSLCLIGGSAIWTSHHVLAGRGAASPALNAAPLPEREARADPEEVLPIDKVKIHKGGSNDVPKEEPLGKSITGVVVTGPVPAGGKALFDAFIDADTKAKKEPASFRAGTQLNILTAGGGTDHADKVTVRRLTRRGQQLFLEIAHTDVTAEGVQRRRNEPVWQLVQVPLQLPAGRYRLEVTNHLVRSDLATPQFTPRPPRKDTIEFTVVDDGMAKSKAVAVKGVEFQTVVRGQVALPAAGAETIVEVGLLIRNRGDKDLVFNLFDTLTPALKTADGKVFRVDGGRNRGRPAAPITVGAGQEETIFRTARLSWMQNGDRLRLVGPDGSGGIWHFDGLQPGRYQLSFRYANAQAGPWVGEVTTEAAAFIIAEAKATPEAPATNK